jgi:hypothetical protein
MMMTPETTPAMARATDTVGAEDSTPAEDRAHAAKSQKHIHRLSPIRTPLPRRVGSGGGKTGLRTLLVIGLLTALSSRACTAMSQVVNSGHHCSILMRYGIA